VQPKTIVFVTTAFNEAHNISELFARCKSAFDAISKEYAGITDFCFRFVIADNCSLDASRTVLEHLSKENQEVTALSNRVNYGPEASAANALKQAGQCDLYVLLCSDLQDPPEIAALLIKALLKQPELDAALAVKKRSSGSFLTRIARRSYYKALDYSSRLQVVPSGFHGFGCYRHEVIMEALRYWDETDLNLRQCLANASQSAVQFDYDQKERQHGSSSYKNGRYWVEAFRSLFSADAAASRLALLISTWGFILSILMGILLLANFLSGKSGYGRGIPTIMGLTLLGFALETLMVAILSRQIESLRIGGFKPRVRFYIIGSESGD